EVTSPNRVIALLDMHTYKTRYYKLPRDTVLWNWDAKQDRIVLARGHGTLRFQVLGRGWFPGTWTIPKDSQPLAFSVSPSGRFISGMTERSLWLGPLGNSLKDLGGGPYG